MVTSPKYSNKTSLRVKDHTTLSQKRALFTWRFFHCDGLFVG